VALRDELEIIFPTVRSRTDVWLDSQTEDFRAEFTDLARDQTIGHNVLLRLAAKYGLKLGSSAFADWRKALWALETN
jgi:hypothetical protein